MPKRIPLKDRFWTKVDQSGGPDACWLWTAAVNRKDYGQIEEGRQMWRAHRIAYEWTVGPIPPGMQIDHKCHVHRCVNPKHLQVVTQQKNRENLSGAYATSKSGVRGVYWNKNEQKWQAQCSHKGRKYHGGLHASLEEAERAVIALRNSVMTNNLLDRQPRLSAEE